MPGKLPSPSSTQQQQGPQVHLPGRGRMGSRKGPFPIKLNGNALPSSAILDWPGKNFISQVIESNPWLTQANKVNTLAARIVRDAVYGENLMKKCTALGGRELPGIPRNEL